MLEVGDVFGVTKPFTVDGLNFEINFEEGQAWTYEGSVNGMVRMRRDNVVCGIYETTLMKRFLPIIND